MIFDETDKERFEPSNECYSCNKQFDDIKIMTRKVLQDHCHFTGKFRVAMHWSCKLKMKDQQNIPVIFHNLKGYDDHLFIKRLTDIDKGTISYIPRNKENFTTFRKQILVDVVSYEGESKTKEI